MATNTINLLNLLSSSFTASEAAFNISETLAHEKIGWVVNSIEDRQKNDLVVVDKLTKAQVHTIETQNIPCLILKGKLKSEWVSKLDTDLNLREITQRLIQTITDHESHTNQHRLNIHKQLSSLAADGVRISGIVRAMAEISGKGVLINDKRMKTIAEQSSPDLSSGWSEIVRVLGSFEFLPEELQDRKKLGEFRLTMRQVLDGGLERIIIPIIAAGVARGYLSVIGSSGSLDEIDQVTAEEGALICAMEMSRTKAVRETEKRLQSDLLTALLKDDLTPRDARMWVSELGLDPDQNHAAVQFAWSSDQAPSRRRLETIISGEVARLRLKSIINPTGENVICFCEVSAGASRPDNVLQLAGNILQEAAREFSHVKAYCGIGSIAYSIDRWLISFREAGQALEMGFQLRESKPQYYPDLSVYRLLMQLENDPELSSFYQDVLGKLIAEDNKNTLTDTLKVYYQNKGNVSQTAKALYIHRNTLSYRLNKIVEIIGSDLTNHDTALSIQLALKIHQMQ